MAGISDKTFLALVGCLNRLQCPFSQPITGIPGANQYEYVEVDQICEDAPRPGLDIISVNKKRVVCEYRKFVVDTGLLVNQPPFQDVCSEMIHHGTEHQADRHNQSQIPHGKL